MNVRGHTNTYDTLLVRSGTHMHRKYVDIKKALNSEQIILSFTVMWGNI
jgi:hypothetical protein